MKTWLAIALLCLVVAAGAFFALRGAPETEADRVRAAIVSCADGARRGHVNDTLAAVSRSYKDADGLEYDTLKGFLFAQYRKRGSVAVVLGPIAVTFPSPDEAHASFDAALADGLEITSLDLMPDNTDLVHFEVDLRREPEDAWRVVGHTREGAPLR